MADTVETTLLRLQNLREHLSKTLQAVDNDISFLKQYLGITGDAKLDNVQPTKGRALSHVFQWSGRNGGQKYCIYCERNSNECAPGETCPSR